MINIYPHIAHSAFLNLTNERVQLKLLSSLFLRIKPSIFGFALLIGTAMLLQPEAAYASLDSKDQRIRALSDSGVKLYTMDCGRVEMSDTDFLADDGSMKGVPGKSVVPCFLIRHAQGDLIWDTGLPEKTKENVPKPDAAFRFELKQTLTEQLQTIGLTPSAVKFVSFSHLHFDHAGNGNLFASATWIVSKNEWKNAFSQQARDRGESIHYDKLKSAKKIIMPKSAPYDVFGDRSVLIYPAPGHTAGHTMLLVRFKENAPVLLTGDLWIMKESQERRLVPKYNDSKAETLRSMAYAESLAKKTGARIIRQHVIEDFDSLPKFPEALK